MSMAIWHLWILAALFFVILEIFTAGFAVMCFSFGGIAAAICSVCGLSLLWQILAFAIFTALAFVCVRPFVLRVFFKDDKHTIKTNADALIGRQARVTERIDTIANTGRVAVDGDDWKAISIDNSVIEIGTIVTIVSRDSIILTVQNITKQ